MTHVTCSFTVSWGLHAAWSDEAASVRNIQLWSWFLFLVCGLQICLSKFSSVAQSCLTLCKPMDCSTPGFPVRHQLLELAQTHVHPVSETIQPSHPVLSQHQGLSQWVSSLHQVAKMLELQLQHQSFQLNIQDLFPLGLTGWISLQSEGLSRIFSYTTVQKLQFFGTQPSLWSNSHIHTWLTEKL